MYNEGAEELALTLRAICKNVKYMSKRLRRPTLWQSIAAVIVSDGRAKAAPSTLKLGEDLGILSVSAMANARSSTQVHLFESILRLPDSETHETRLPPLQTIFAIKERNAGKLNSHLWFFEGFAYVMQPRFTFLLDVGTIPRSEAFYGFYNELESNSDVAGVCGRLLTQARTACDWINPIVAAQRFEYEVAALLDLSFQTSMGFLAVLPGAFSAYRYQALLGEPLRKYFSQLYVADKDLDPFTTNMTLAEDRLLCYHLIAKKDCSYTLRYVNSSIAETDVPHDLVSLLKQRRRWLNGSLFALLYALVHFFSFWRQSSHSVFRKLAISYVYLFFVIQVIIQWLAMGVFFLVIVLISANLGIPPILYNSGAVAFVVLLVVQFVLSAQNRPQDLRVAYNMTSALFGIMFIVLVAITIGYSLIQIRKGNIILIVTLGLAWGIYIGAGLLHGALTDILVSFVPFVALLPSFLIVFPVYALTNTHDVSWGTKDLNTAAEPLDEMTREIVRHRFSRFRTVVVVVWILSNILLVFLVAYFNASNIFLTASVLLILLLNGSRLLGSVFYLTGGRTSSSLLVKFFVAPITLRAYVAVLKLPFAAFASIAYLVAASAGYFVATANAYRGFMFSMADLDVRFTHLWTSSNIIPARDSLIAFDTGSPRSDIATPVLKRTQVYFLALRWMISLAAALLFSFCAYLISLIASQHAANMLTCAACRVVINAITTLPAAIPILVLALVMLNVAWAGDATAQWAALKYLLP
ncbi:unnamed protein product (mitochondrion) [Plasmodiophora brassicae]|uniref:chitin synthase n=1 Tax=Plasmodiophora brassicae TaxID=37360 RepID=A0A0G4IMN9_PLABS|nr:hypothetical protein PBRA_005038 [Plasmodiophora brassicae]SPQ99307.1 unnamed protein product [Plasmodiophora brassicae]